MKENLNKLPDIFLGGIANSCVKDRPPDVAM
jgi:hypothetical protein